MDMFLGEQVYSSQGLLETARVKAGEVLNEGGDSWTLYKSGVASILNDNQELDLSVEGNRNILAVSLLNQIFNISRES